MIGRLARRAIGALAILAGVPVAAQEPPVPTAIAVPPQPGAFPLGTGRMAGGAPRESWFAFNRQATVRNVVEATLMPVLPNPGTATGAAVIVAPGGGFIMLSMDNEGWPVARWLADRGIAAFVLKYRLRPTPVDDAAFGGVLSSMFGPSRPAGPRAPLATPAESIADGAAALALVRSRAATWGVDPHRIGILGFSAGGRVALDVTTGAASGARPAFLASIYGAGAPGPMPADAPPLFAVQAADDRLVGLADVDLFQAWHAAGRPAELHVYSGGGHGFGMGRPGTTGVTWLDAFYRWLDVSGFLKARP